PRPHRALPSFPTRRSSDLRRGMRRPSSSTSPSSAASSTDGKHNDNGRIVDRREGTSRVLKTLFRMRNRNSTIYCLLDLFGHNQLDRKSTRLNSSHVSISYA